MADLNVVALTGNLTRDPEVRFGKSGTAFCELGLAVNDIKDRNGDEVVYFFEVVCFGKTAEFVGEYVKKGHKVSISGKLAYDSWETDGQRRSKVYIKAERVNRIGGNGKPKQEGGDTPRPDERKEKGQSVEKPGPPPMPQADGDDIPF